MSEERENQKGAIVPEPDVEGHAQVARSDEFDPEQDRTKLANEEADVEGHAQVAHSDESDPEQDRTKLANDEDEADVEGHLLHQNITPNQTP